MHEGEKLYEQIAPSNKIQKYTIHDDISTASVRSAKQASKFIHTKNKQKPIAQL